MIKACLLITILLVGVIAFPYHVGAALEFNISNPTVESDKISFSAEISGATNVNCPDGKCYFQGGIRYGSGNYFGFTKNNLGSYIAYVSSPDTGFIKENFLYCEIVDGKCNYAVEMRFNRDDPHYKGPGEYTLKLKRYTGNSSDGKDSNELTVELKVATPQPTSSPTPTPTPTPSPTAYISPTPEASQTPKPTQKPTQRPTSSATPKVEPTANPTDDPMILGTATEPPKVVGATDESYSTPGKTPPAALVMIAGGLGATLVAGVSMLRSRYNERPESP